MHKLKPSYFCGCNNQVITTTDYFLYQSDVMLYSIPVTIEGKGRRQTREAS